MYNVLCYVLIYVLMCIRAAILLEFYVKSPRILEDLNFVEKSPRNLEFFSISSKFFVNLFLLKANHIEYREKIYDFIVFSLS